MRLMLMARVMTVQSIITNVNKSLYVTIGTSSLLLHPAADISPLRFPYEAYYIVLCGNPKLDTQIEMNMIPDSLSSESYKRKP